MLGFAQEAWLHSNLAHSKAQWNLIAQDVLMAQLGIKQDGGFGFSTDDWDGYPANRARLLKRIHDSQVSNPVVVGGDAHSFFANDLRLDSTIRRPRWWRLNSSAPRYRPSVRLTKLSRERCRTIRTSISSKAGGVAMSALIWNVRTCRCACGQSRM